MRRVEREAIWCANQRQNQPPPALVRAQQEEDGHKPWVLHCDCLEEREDFAAIVWDFVCYLRECCCKSTTKDDV